MSETEKLWGQMFQDKPIPEVRLERLKLDIMSHISEHPIDFQHEIVLSVRRRWGIILLSLLIASGFGLVLLVYYKGYLFVDLLGTLVWSISGFLPSSWLSLFWQNIEPSVLLISGIKSVIEFLWRDYSWSLMSVIVLLVVIHGMKTRMLTLPK